MFSSSESIPLGLKPEDFENVEAVFHSEENPDLTGSTSVAEIYSKDNQEFKSFAKSRSFDDGITYSRIP